MLKDLMERWADWKDITRASLVLNNIDDALLEQLEQAAIVNGTTVEEMATHLLFKSKPFIYDSVDLIRESREWRDSQIDERIALFNGALNDLSYFAISNSK